MAKNTTPRKILSRKIYDSNGDQDISSLEQTIQIISNQYKDKPLYLDSYSLALGNS
jgi:hypothetical protein